MGRCDTRERGEGSGDRDRGTEIAANVDVSFSAMDVGGAHFGGSDDLTMAAFVWLTKGPRVVAVVEECRTCPG